MFVAVVVVVVVAVVTAKLNFTGNYKVLYGKGISQLNAIMDIWDIWDILDIKKKTTHSTEKQPIRIVDWIINPYN